MSVFPVIKFKNQQNDHVETISKSSYVWAGLFGPLYLMFKGFWGKFFLHFLVLQPLVTIGVFLIGTLLSGFVDTSNSEYLSAGGAGFMLLVMFGSVALYLYATAKITVASARVAYLRMGWKDVS